MVRVAPASSSDNRFRLLVPALVQHDGIVFLVSGGGGGKPEFVNRSAADIYQSRDFPNFHYLRFELTARQLRGEMVRLTDADAPFGPTWRGAGSLRSGC